MWCVISISILLLVLCRCFIWNGGLIFNWKGCVVRCCRRVGCLVVVILCVVCIGCSVVVLGVCMICLGFVGLFL